MTNRALLIGINRYKIPGADLRGCVNDVKNLQGAPTCHLAAALNEAQGKISYRDPHGKTIAKLKRGKYDRVPQPEGRKCGARTRPISILSRHFSRGARARVNF